MKQDVEDQRFMSINGFVQAIGPDDAQRSLHHETLIAAEFDRYHSGDPFQDLKHRARFSEEDQDLLKEWRALAAVRTRELALETR